LPTLSFQRNDASTAQLVSTALFGDGAAAVLLTGRASDSGVSVLDAETHLFPDTLNLLGFDLHDDGLHVVLAKELPDTLRTAFGAVVDRLLARSGIARADVECCVFHPGGTRILLAIEEALGLDRARTQPAWDVLREYGNMSSAAVLFVLERCMKELRPRPGAYGLLGAFGRGFPLICAYCDGTSPHTSAVHGPAAAGRVDSAGGVAAVAAKPSAIARQRGGRRERATLCRDALLHIAILVGAGVEAWGTRRLLIPGLPWRC